MKYYYQTPASLVLYPFYAPSFELARRHLEQVPEVILYDEHRVEIARKSTGQDWLLTAA